MFGKLKKYERRKADCKYPIDRDKNRIKKYIRDCHDRKDLLKYRLSKKNGGK